MYFSLESFYLVHTCHLCFTLVFLVMVELDLIYSAEIHLVLPMHKHCFRHWGDTVSQSHRPQGAYVFIGRDENQTSKQ